MAGKGYFYLHLFGEVAGRSGIYGLDDVPKDQMPDKFWVEFPKCEPLHLKTLTASQVSEKFIDYAVSKGTETEKCSVKEAPYKYRCGSQERPPSGLSGRTVPPSQDRPVGHSCRRQDCPGPSQEHPAPSQERLVPSQGCPGRSRLGAGHSRPGVGCSQLGESVRPDAPAYPDAPDSYTVGKKEGVVIRFSLFSFCCAIPHLVDSRAVFRQSSVFFQSHKSSGKEVVLTKLGAWGFQLESVVSVSSQEVPKLTTEGCFGLNAVAPSQRPIFCWILCRQPRSVQVECGKNRQRPSAVMEAHDLSAVCADNVSRMQP
ncbi:unnamed protein product [Notodromas monacha]|uniref:Uncharacterized protein n=1 Tax=Notodromas monacha TaxID=399045 RepID=A0A7R9BHC9_9CRUS|nr:unnamed protein product [Notodromas monacha]CAG0914680.1 unnamed protein product [Notodromas monacha]